MFRGPSGSLPAENPYNTKKAMSDDESPELGLGTPILHFIGFRGVVERAMAWQSLTNLKDLDWSRKLPASVSWSFEGIN